jgi:hypothetical protein
VTPPALGRIIAKCLEHDVERRYQHAAEIRTDLLRLKLGTGSKPTVAKYWKMIAAGGRVDGDAGRLIYTCIGRRN